MASAQSTPTVKRSALSDKIVRNVVFGGLRSALIAPIPFVLTPLILHEIGVIGYGTWAVFLAINGMTSLADLGLVGTVSKFVAEHNANGDHVSLNRLLNTGFAVFCLLTFVLVGALYAGSSYFTQFLFRESNGGGAELTTLFRYFLVVIAANILTLLFSSVTTGLQRMDLTNIMSAFNTLCAAVIGAILLVRGWGLRGLLYGQICAATLTVFGYLILVKKLLPLVRLSPVGIDAGEAKKIFTFSLRFYFTQAAVAVHNNIEKLLLASFVGVAAAGWYDIANDVALKIRGVVGLVLGPVMPAASELAAKKDDRRLVELYYRAHKYLAFLGLPIICYATLVSSRFVELWIGPKFAVVALPLSVLLVVNFVNLVTGPGFLIFAGKGNLGPGVQSATLGLVLNVLLSFVLILRFGFAGAVAGTSIAITVASLYFMYQFHRLTRNPVGRLVLESYARPFAWSIVLAAGLYLARAPFESTWKGLALQGILYGGLYLVGVLFSQFFDSYDWAKIERAIPLARYVRRMLPVA
jgi:O-antigen/teichoic acid export membrane protein